MTPPCPRRHLHAGHIAPLLLASGHMLLRCECGALYLKRIERERN